jgi:hypothetical protein
MANTAAGLHDRTLDRSLEREDNNAAVKIMMRDGNLVAILYAISIILPGEEILWDYGICYDDDDEDASEDIVPAGRHPQPAAHPFGGAPTDHRSGPFSSRCLMVSAAEESFRHDCVILDCASGTNLCKSKNHASNIRPCVRGTIIGIEGASSGTHYDHSCTFVDAALGRMPLATEASANIVSLAVARDRGFAAEYCNELDEFTLVSPHGSRYVFGRLPESSGVPRKFYVMDLDTLTPPSEEGTRILCTAHAIDPTDRTEPAGTRSRTRPSGHALARIAEQPREDMPRRSRKPRCRKIENTPKSNPPVTTSSVHRDQIGEIDLFLVGACCS